MNNVKAEIVRLEKALNALVQHPKLIRRSYWMSQIEGLLELAELSRQDRQRLQTLRTCLNFGCSGNPP